MFSAEKTTNNHPTTQTDLHPIPKARIVSEPIPINSPSAGCGTLGIKGLLVVGCVMSWAAAERRGPECAGMWRLKGAKPGCTGIHGGTGWGKGGECPKREKDLTQFVSHTPHGPMPNAYQ